MRGAELLVEMLVRHGVTTIFGVPGDTNVPLYDALRRRTADIEHVMARDERSAGFMADAYARLQDRPAVIECPSGAGSMYSLPPVAESHASSVPVILLTIDVPLAGEGRGTITELDCAKLYEPVTKLSLQVKSADKLPEIVRRAFRTACSGTPGAVHLQIPEDLLLAEVDVSSVSLHAETACTTFPAHTAAPPREALDACLRLLREHRRPVIVAGGGVNRARAGRTLAAVAQALNVPVVTTLTGQCALPAEHPLLFGVAGDNGFHPVANRALEEADLVLVLGSKMGSVLTSGGRFPTATLHRRVVQVDIEPARLGNNFENLLSIACDLQRFLDGLLQAVPPGFEPRRHQPWIDRLADGRAEFRHWADLQARAEQLPLRPERVMRELALRIDASAGPVNLLCDAGTPTPYASRFLRLREGSHLVIPRAYGGLGSALPGAVGAWYADRTRRPVALFGDGSFNMTVGELETLVRKRVPAVLLLFNNACFGWIKGVQRMRGDEAFGVDFEAPRGQAIAEAFGLAAWTARTPAELAHALEQAFEHSGPCLVDIHVESLAERVPPVMSWLVKAGRDPLRVGG